ncbi:single-stranded DNA-binding protein [Phocaeicola plebeius]|jgi:single-strand DNA-binding protein
MLNKVMLIGHLGKDLDVRTLDSGTKVCQFTLATTEKGYTLQNGTQVPDRTEWHNLVLWKGLAEVAGKYLHKGDKVFIEGKIRSRSYEDNSKVKRYITEIFADNMEILSTTSKSGSQNNVSEAPLPSETPSDDLPF